MRKTEKLYEAITEIDEELIENAESYIFPKSGILRKNHTTSKLRHYAKLFVAAAASICLIYGIGFLFIWGPAGDGGSGNALGSSYMSYAGPIFPLTSTSDVTGIEVTRHTNWDFSPYESEIRTENMHPDIPDNTETFTYERYETESILSENYILTNSTNEDRSLTLYYPFAARFTDTLHTIPTISVNDTAIDTSFLAGKYSGSYAPAWGDKETDEQLNLNEPSNWTDYKALLSDGTYLSDTMSEFPSLDIPIIVYEYSNLTYIGEEEATNPTFAIHYKHDSTKSTITGWGWNAAGWEGDGSGYYGCSRVYVPGGNEIDKGATAYFIIIGEDIDTPTVKGYLNGSCEENNEIEGVTADFRKYETTMKEFLINVCLAEYVENMEFTELTEITIEHDDSGNCTIQNLLTQEMVLGYIAQLMYDDGILSGDCIERYDNGWLETYVYEFRHMARVMYLTFDVTIPAASSITIDAVMTKDASIDFAGKNLHRNGYDMVTTLASPFTFTKQTASLSNYEHIEMLDQNFGFDLENGITNVELDLTEEHYWMDIKKKSNTE